MSGRNSYIEKICIYSEFIDNILINNERFEGIKENYYFIYDKIYLDFLTEIVTDKLSKHNIYPKEIIEQFKEIIKRYKGYLMIDNERWDLIDEYNKIYETLDNIDEFNNDYLLINYRLKYDELGKIHKLSGVNFEEMTQSMLYDYPVLCNLLDGVLDEEIDYKYYLASLKKFKAIYPALFTIPSFNRTTKKVLNKIIKKTDDEEIIRDCKKNILLLKNQDGYYNVYDFETIYYCHLIIGMATNYHFNELFRQQDEKVIMSEDFITCLKNTIELTEDGFDERVMANLLTITNHIFVNLKNYYDEDKRKQLSKELNDIKVAINVQKGNNNNFYLSNIKTRESQKNYLKYVLYFLRAKYHIEDILDLENEIMNSEYTLSQILKSFTVSDEEFLNDYYQKFIDDELFIKSVRKLLFFYPSIFKEDIAYNRIKKVMLDKLDTLEHDELEKETKSEYKQLLKKISKYNV